MQQQSRTEAIFLFSLLEISDDFGIYSKFFKYSAAICFCDQIPTGKVAHNKKVATEIVSDLIWARENWSKENYIVPVLLNPLQLQFHRT